MAGSTWRKNSKSFWWEYFCWFWHKKNWWLSWWMYKYVMYLVINCVWMTQVFQFPQDRCMLHLPGSHGIYIIFHFYHPPFIRVWFMERHSSDTITCLENLWNQRANRKNEMPSEVGSSEKPSNYISCDQKPKGNHSQVFAICSTITPTFMVDFL